MRAIDLVTETASAFNSNRVRSFLTVLGIVIGIAAVISMTALIGGLKSALVGEMGLSQARLVYMWCSYGRDMALSDVTDMANDLESYFEYVTPVSTGTADVVTATKKASGSIRGVNPEYAKVQDLKLAQGRFFTQRESDSGALVAVLDEPSVKTLFGSSTTQAVGKTVRISGADYEVVGVVSSDAAVGESDSANVLMPFATCAQRIVGSMSVTQTLGLVHEDGNPEQAGTAAENWLVQRFRIPESERENSVNVTSLASIIEQLDTLMASFQLLMTVVASISLLVGGIGIMNMMLTNVTERIREIGLRKALGARNRDITRQFLLESICLTLVGGAFGIALGFAGAFGLAGLASGAFGLTEGLNLTPTIGPDAVLLVAGICVLIGVVFGYYPARRAAKLDPVESLRYQ